MNALTKRFAILSFMLIIPAFSFAVTNTEGHFHVYAPIISYINVALEITSAICIKQFFILGDAPRVRFQLFNLIFGIVFYLVALNFLVSQKAYYGMEQLSASQCISKFFFGMGVYSALQWMVIVAMVLNVIYIKKYHDA